MLEVGVAAAVESFQWSRNRASVIITAIIFLVGLPSALSYSAAGTTINGIRVFDYMDETVGTLGLPIAAVIMAIVFCWFIPKEKVPDELTTHRGLTRWVFPLCKYVIPPLLIIATAARLLAGFDFAGTRVLPGGEVIGSLLQVEGIIFILAIVVLVSSLSAGSKVAGSRDGFGGGNDLISKYTKLV